MLTIHNDGGLDRDYSRLELISNDTRLSIYPYLKGSNCGSVVMSRDTARALRDELTRWLGDGKSAELPAIEGSL